MRRFLINELETAAQTLQPVILSGRSGVGKTLLLQRIQRKIDLEHIYNHRGSVFGIHATPQPSQINVDNQLAITLLKFRHQNIIRLVFEDESANIGSRRIPESLLAMLQRAPLVVLETNDNERVDITFEEYVTSALAEYQSMYGEASGFAQWANYLLTAVDSIKRRLGGERHSRIKQIMENAIENHRQLGDTSAHRDWIYALLTNYYDPMYNYQLSNKAERVEFQGGGEAVLEYLRHKFGIS